MNDNGVTLLLVLKTNEIYWNEPISPAMFILELRSLFDKNQWLELNHSHIAPSKFDYTLEYTLEVPTFKLKEIYDVANNLLT